MSSKWHSYDDGDVVKPLGSGSPPQAGTEHVDTRGSIQRLNPGGFNVNMLFTKAGNMRSGDLHQNTQFDFIYSGKMVRTISQKEMLV